MSALHLLLVGIDGLRLDLATEERAPHLRGLIARGASTSMTMPVPTISGPGWATLLTGASHAEHGVVDNTFVGSRLAGIPDLLSRAFFADPSRTTFAAAAWPPLVDPVGVGPVIHTRDEQRRAERHRVIVRDGETYGYRTTDAEIADFAVAGLFAAGPDVSFVYWSGVDEAGHVHGARSDEYAAAITRTDAYLGRLLEVVEHRAAAGERWLVAATTDHGHVDVGGHGGGEPEVVASFVVRAAWNAGLDAWPASIEPAELTPRLLAALA
ncbi:alkaline phosphatase family protein [Amnibacterium kyonggiense]|uniref:Type I phosphodiesterase/nucleotide pyrophosphatase n=1 Tax=Amnibacterium kyonggiense TaxID=595671 RepID=A0A4R7FQ45_9MICO|nr:alkaline phosphatase family protein [Amnibacterium kyonggiense]TDS79892.1 type I phosphodiesterase/nucleotide pyrophosphatase [Amnibacterium kyonggiense]